MAINLRGCNSPGSSGAIGKVWIRIADLTIALAGNTPGLKLNVEGAMQSFLVDESAPDMRVLAAWGNLRDEHHGRMVFDSGGLWQLYRQHGTYCFRFRSPALGPLPYKIACFDSSFTSGEVHLHRHYFQHDRSVYPLEYPLDELLMIHLLADGRGVQVHACAVIDSSGRAHLFAGQSGADKTTMAKLWRQEDEVIILNDDRIILRNIGGKLWMYGTPWHGEAGLAHPAWVPLTQIYFLRHGQKNEVVSQRPAESVGRLFAHSFPPFYSRAGLDFTLGFFEEVVTAVPCDELRFLPDRRVIEFIRQQTL